jgi:hypothetical protein
LFYRLLAIAIMTIFVGAPKSWASEFTYHVMAGLDWCNASNMSHVLESPEDYLEHPLGFQLRYWAFYEVPGCTAKIDSMVTFDCSTGTYVTDSSTIDEIQPTVRTQEGAKACAPIFKSAPEILRKFREEVSNQVIPVPKMDKPEVNNEEIPKQMDEILPRASDDQRDLFDESKRASSESPDETQVEVPLEKVQTATEEALEKDFVLHRDPKGGYVGIIAFTTGKAGQELRLVLQFNNPVDADRKGFSLTKASLRRLPRPLLKALKAPLLNDAETKALNQLMVVFTPPDAPLLIWLKEEQLISGTEDPTPALTRYKAVRKVEEKQATFIKEGPVVK